MQCTECNTANDPDAAYCSECGKPVAPKQQAGFAGFRKPYLAVSVLALVALLVAGLGYYKFILPNGVAAVVNGDEIKLAEVDAAVFSVLGKQDEPNSGIRRRVLNQLIMERIVLQEARKAGVALSEAERVSVRADARASSGLGEAEFKRQIQSRYSDMSAFENTLERRFLINKFLAQKIVPRGADSPAAGLAVDRWIQDITGRASVRVTLAEQGPGPGCGCCNTGGGTGTAQPDKL